MMEADVDENGYVPLEEAQPPIPPTLFYRRPRTQVKAKTYDEKLATKGMPCETYLTRF